MSTSPGLLTLLLLTLTALDCGEAKAAHRGFLLTAPKRLLSGTSENLCLTFHNVTGDVRVQILLLELETNKLIGNTGEEYYADGGKCMKLLIPHTPLTRANLQLIAVFGGVKSYFFSSEREVQIQKNPILTFIQPDKPVYKPGELVRFRILSLDHNLMPVIRPIRRIWIETPSQICVAQWLKVQSKKGLIEKEFQLSYEPQKGNWKIKVEHDWSTAEHSTFSVQEYVLPRFQVIIKPPDFILADTSYVSWIICARYSYGQPIRGKLNVKVDSIIPAWRQKTRPPTISFTTKLEKDDGCYNFTISSTDLGLNDWKMSPSSILLQASVTESSTNIKGHSNYTSLVFHQALNLDFVTFSSQYFKPELPYSGKVKVTHPNDIPAPGKEIQVCLKVQAVGEWNRALVECKNFTSNSDGFVEFVVPPQHQNTVLLSFAATAVSYPTKYYSADKRWRVFMDQPSSFFDVNAWYSPTQSYITFFHGNTAKCNAQHNVTVLYTHQNDSEFFTLHYLVKARGDIIFSSSINHQHNRMEIDYLKTFKNVLGYVGNHKRNTQNQVTTDRTTGQLTLHLNIQPEMSPLMYLIVFYIRKDSEVVAATHTIQVEKCLSHIVYSAFSQSQQLPGSVATLTVHAAPGSLCALTSVDKQTSFIASSESLDTDRVFKELSRFHIDGSSIPRQYDDWEYCSKKNKPVDTPIIVLSNITRPDYRELRRNRRSPTWGRSKLMIPRLTVYVDAIQAFEEFGAVAISDLKLETRPCYTPKLYPDDVPRFLKQEPSVALHMIDKPSSRAYESSVGYNDHAAQPAVDVRTFFPETWLWDLFDVGDLGKIKIEREMPHTITDWITNVICISRDEGLGVAATTNITAFQPFFLDYITPYSIKRGEILVLKVGVFNFLPYSIPVKMNIANSFDFELLSNNSESGSCIHSHTTFTQEYRIRASVIGFVNISVTAETDSLYPDLCGPELLFSRRDVLVKPILVEPEGFPVEITKSSLICPDDFKNRTKMTWLLETSQDVVEDSARAEIKVVTDLLTPTIHNLDQLVRMPVGCGEQNMILFVPNLLAFNYMKQKGVSYYERMSAIQNLMKGYQRQLNYRREDGSYSAFGNSDESGSMWLTAFVVKYFAQARKLIFMDDNDLKISMEWIVKKQLENGCFPLVGQVFQKDIKGGLSEESTSSALTAYVLISILEKGLDVPRSVKSNALFCLRGDSEPDVYSLSLITYAYSLLKETMLAKESLRHLIGSAIQQEDLLWWEKPGSSSKSLKVEITSYAILSLLTIGGEENYINALKAVRWLSMHINVNGGFISTQDTIIALEALAKFGVSMPQIFKSITLRVMATELNHTFTIHQAAIMLQNHVYLPVLPTEVSFEASGLGCALIQSCLRYNVKTPTGSDAFELDVETGPVASVDICTVQKLEICLRYKLMDQTSNMAVLEVSMVTGYIPDRTSLHKLLDEKTTTLKRWEEDKNKVNFYFEAVTNKRQCIGFMVMQEIEIENPKSAVVKLYDYYHPELMISKKYSTDAGCLNEQLPLPQPEISNVNMFMDQQDISESYNEKNDSLAKEVYMNKTTVSNTSSDTNTSRHLNTQFVNVDHELDFPSGNEGPQPAYALPQADDVSSYANENGTSCPICTNSFKNFTSLYCQSSFVYKLIIRKHGNIRLVLDLSPGKSVQRIRKPIFLVMGQNCKCLQLKTVGNHVLLLNTQTAAEGITESQKLFMMLNSSIHIITTPVHAGQPEAIKSARTKCLQN